MGFLAANAGKPRMSWQATDPAGLVTVIDAETDTAATVDFTFFND